MLADNSNVQQKLAQELTMRSVLPHRFARAPADYYSRDLEYRRQVNYRIYFNKIVHCCKPSSAVHVPGPRSK